MAATPAYASTVATAVAQISTANTARDGTGTIVDVGTAAPAAGRRIDVIEIIATGTTTQGKVRLFIHNGSAWRLWREVDVQANTPSASTNTFSAQMVPAVAGQPLLILPSGHKIGAAPHNAETFNVVVVSAGDLT